MLRLLRSKQLKTVERSELLRSTLPRISPVSYRLDTTAARSRPNGSKGSQRGPNNSSWSWLLLLPAGFASFLGVWQVNRYRWKVELLKIRENGFKTIGQGYFQHDKSIYIGPRPRTVMGTAEAGYTLITPLISADGQCTALVNRGWVPAEWRTNAKTRSMNSPTEEVEVIGVVRSSEKPSSFVPPNEPENGIWFWIDVPAMAESCDLPRDATLIETFEIDRELQQAADMPTSMDVLAFKARSPKQRSLYPMPKTLSDLMRVSVMPIDHRNYALTWFSLSGATAYLALKVVRATPLAK